MDKTTTNPSSYGLVDNRTTHSQIEVAFLKEVIPTSKSSLLQPRENDVKPGVEFQILETLASVATTSDPTSLLTQQQPPPPTMSHHSNKHELVDALTTDELTLMDIGHKTSATVLRQNDFIDSNSCGFNLESEANKLLTKKRKRKNMLQKLKTEKNDSDNQKIGKKKSGSKKKKMKLLGVSAEMSTSRMPSASAILETPPRDGMDKEIELIQNFKCDCKYGGEGESCIRQFNDSAVLQLRYSMSDVTSYEKDLLLLGKLSCTINVSRLTNCTRRREQKERQQQRILYYVENHRVCRATFKFMHKISQNKLTALIKWYKGHGLTPRKKRIGGKKISNAITPDHKLVQKKTGSPKSPIMGSKTSIQQQPQSQQKQQQPQSQQKQQQPQSQQKQKQQQHQQAQPSPLMIQHSPRPQRVPITQPQQQTQTLQQQHPQQQQAQQVQHVQHAFLQQSLIRQSPQQMAATMQMPQHHTPNQYIPQFHHHNQTMQYHHLLTPQQQAYSMPQPNFMQ